MTTKKQRLAEMRELVSFDRFAALVALQPQVCAGSVDTRIGLHLGSAHSKDLGEEAFGESLHALVRIGPGERQ